VTSEYLFEMKHDSRSSFVRQTCYLRVFRVVVDDQQIVLSLKRKNVDANFLPWSLWNRMWMQRLGGLLSPETVGGRTFGDDVFYIA